MLPSLEGRGTAPFRFGKRSLPTKGDPKVRRLVRGPLLYLGIVALALWLFVNFSQSGAAPKELTFTKLEQLARDGAVESATFLGRDFRVEGELAGGDPYVAPYPPETEDDLVQVLQAAGVDVSADPQQ
ncbi:MAG: ATP-dependent metallopeptidase FtsH/Yme1/Tma family protein, partial [Actinomycetota bacterium]